MGRADWHPVTPITPKFLHGTLGNGKYQAWPALSSGGSNLEDSRYRHERSRNFAVYSPAMRPKTASRSDSSNASDRLATARSAVDFADASCSTVVLTSDAGIQDSGASLHRDASGN
jgi:hypothetical protein